jgi:hypothetical protein
VTRQFAGDRDIKGVADFRNKGGSDGEDEPDVEEESDREKEQRQTVRILRSPSQLKFAFSSSNQEETQSRTRRPTSASQHAEPARRPDVPGAQHYSTRSRVSSPDRHPGGRRPSTSNPPQSQSQSDVSGSYYSYPPPQPHSQSQQTLSHSQYSSQAQYSRNENIVDADTATNPLAKLYSGLTTVASSGSNSNPVSRQSSSYGYYPSTTGGGPTYGSNQGSGLGGMGNYSSTTPGAGNEYDSSIFFGGVTAGGQTAPGGPGSNGSVTTQSPTPAPTPPQSNMNAYLYNNPASLQTLSAGFGGLGVNGVAPGGPLNPFAPNSALGGLGPSAGPGSMVISNLPDGFNLSDGARGMHMMNMNNATLFASLVSQAQSQAHANLQFEREKERGRDRDDRNYGRERSLERGAGRERRGSRASRERERDRDRDRDYARPGTGTGSGFQWPSTGPHTPGASSSVGRLQNIPGSGRPGDLSVGPQQATNWMQSFSNNPSGDPAHPYNRPEASSTRTSVSGSSGIVGSSARDTYEGIGNRERERDRRNRDDEERNRERKTPEYIKEREREQRRELEREREASRGSGIVEKGRQSRTVDDDQGSRESQSQQATPREAEISSPSDIGRSIATGDDRNMEVDDTQSRQRSASLHTHRSHSHEPEEAIDGTGR